MSEWKDQYEDLITDLMYLRKGDGFTVNKARNASTFLEAIGGAGQTFDELTTRFISAICSLEEDQSVQALLVAYGLEPGYQGINSIFERRKKYGKQVRRKYDTLADREQTAIQELAVHLLLGQWVNAPLPANTPVIHGDLISKSQTVIDVISNRTQIESRETQELISLVDGVESYGYITNAPTSVVALEGCKAKSHPVENGIEHNLCFPQPLKRGQIHKISFMELLPEQGENSSKAVPSEIAQAFTIPTFTYHLEITFVGQKPKVIWSYNMLSLLERPGKPEEQTQLFLKDDESTIRMTYTHLHGGMFSGIAWRW